MSGVLGRPRSVRCGGGAVGRGARACAHAHIRSSAASSPSSASAAAASSAAATAAAARATGWPALAPGSSAAGRRESASADQPRGWSAAQRADCTCGPPAGGMPPYTIGIPAIPAAEGRGAAQHQAAWAARRGSALAHQDPSPRAVPSGCRLRARETRTVRAVCTASLARRCTEAPLTHLHHPRPAAAALAAAAALGPRRAAAALGARRRRPVRLHRVYWKAVASASCARSLPHTREPRSRKTKKNTLEQAREAPERDCKER